MNDEYLWDKSGEPDPEIQQLEQILGTLRFQPKSFELPDNVQLIRGNHNLPLLAIAATILMAVFAAGLWLLVKNKSTPQLQNVRVEAPTFPQNIGGPTPPGNKPKESLAIKGTTPNRHRDRAATSRPRQNFSDLPALAKSKRQQALEAKEQLMVALRLASEKLNLAQRKAHGASPNQIRNQHKVG
jgi:hypothetical protein